MVDVVLGSQWGDEGKGKLVDLLVDKSYDLVCRSAGGNNAGHTIVVNGIKYDFHILPSGLINEKCYNVLGNGVVIHIPSFLEELDKLLAKGLKNCKNPEFLKISNRSHLVFNFHQITDKLRESELSNKGKDVKKSIGTTGKGIGPTYSTKASRSGLRMHHLMNDSPEGIAFFESQMRRLYHTRIQRYGEFEYDIEAEIAQYREYRTLLKPYVIDTVEFIHEALVAKKKILVEGANALMLDIDFGTYPYVTSSSTSIGGLCTGLGVPPRYIENIYGVVKAYTTRVGEGPFPTEQLNPEGDALQQIGAEFGVTTGRKRRCGWLDLVVMKYSTWINGYTHLNITKLDVLDTFKEIPVGVAYKDGKTGEILKSFPADLNDLAKVEVIYETLPGWEQDISKIQNYEDLPENCKKYLKFIEDFLQVPIKWIGTGPARDSMIEKI